MKEYTFEYTRQGVAYLLFGLSFGIIILGLCLFATPLRSFLSPGIATISLIVIAVVFFLLNKHRIKRIGIAKLSSIDVTIELDQLTHIVFGDLKYYYVYDGKNGIVFTLGFVNGKKFKIGANNNFCDDEPLKTFLTDLQLVIENYKVENKINIIHLESIFARRYALPILIILTIIVILGFCFTQMPVMILPIGVSTSLLVGWIRYLQLRSGNKLVDF